MDKATQFRNIVEGMANLYEIKNQDYGSSFDVTLEEFGLVAPAIRLSDKLNRFKSLLKSDRVSTPLVDERIEDTLLDLANYAIMTVMWLQNNDLSSN